MHCLLQREVGTEMISVFVIHVPVEKKNGQQCKQWIHNPGLKKYKKKIDIKTYQYLSKNVMQLSVLS